MTEHVIFDPTKRHDLLLLIEAKDCNPNGDPDFMNRPRTDLETSHGLVTHNSIKRKIRDTVSALMAYERPEVQARGGIFVQHGGAFAPQMEEAYRASGVEAAELPKVHLAEDDAAAVIEHLDMEMWEYEREELTYKGEKAVKGLAKKLMVAGVNNNLANLIEGATKPKKKVGASKIEVVQRHLRDTFWDNRMFGGVFAVEAFPAGRMRGPVQFSDGRSVDPVNVVEFGITRVAAHDRKDDDQKHGTMGTRSLVNYGLYLVPGFFAVPFAERQGVTEDDLRLMHIAITNMFDLDRSSSRAGMSLRLMVVFTHDHPLGNAPAHKLLDLVRIERKDPTRPARSFDDYAVELTGDVPAGVTLTVVEHVNMAGVVTELKLHPVSAEAPARRAVRQTSLFSPPQ